MHRRELLVGAAAALVGLRAAPSALAAPPSDDDLAWVRAGLAGEALAASFYKRARHVPRRRALSEQEGIHFAELADVLSAAGATPASVQDFQFTYPRGTFATRAATARVALRIETALVGLYLGGAANIMDADLRTRFARLAAAEARHQGLFEPIGPVLPEALPLDRASALLDPFIA
jgi:hypothetical protein